MKEQIERYFTNDLDIPEQVELLRKVDSDDEYRAEFTRYRNTQALFSFSDEVIDPIDSRKGYDRFLSRRKKQKVFRTIRASIGYAAAIALLLLSMHFYHVYFYPRNAPIGAETSLFVPAGQRVNLTLPDGTVVWLNAQTRLTYPTAFTGNERKVNLQGEAYFEVAHNPEMPFIVSSGGIDMKVLGTTFNVYSYEEEELKRISLIEGSLLVYDPQSESPGIILKPNEEITINDSEMIVNTIPNADYFLWKDGIYSFDNEKLEVILKKLELYYDIEIRIKDESMRDWKYTVKFRQRDGIDEILRLLQKIHPFRVKKDNENNHITIT